MYRSANPDLGFGANPDLGFGARSSSTPGEPCYGSASVVRATHIGDACRALVPIDVCLSKIAFDSKLQFRGAVIVSATSRGDTARIEAELRSLLRDRHHLAPGDDDDFIIRNSNPE
jgi:hypothetical protein